MNGCLEKLATSILQIQRLSNHQNEHLIMAFNNFAHPNARDQVFLGSEISSDFESLLLQSRAALDRLTNFITRRYGKRSYTDSGADNPVSCGSNDNTGNGAAPATYFDARFCGEPGVRRSLQVNDATAMSVVATQLPGIGVIRTMVLVIVLCSEDRVVQ